MTADPSKLQELLNKKLVTWTINQARDTLVLTFEGGVEIEVQSPVYLNIWLVRPVKEVVC